MTDEVSAKHRMEEQEKISRTYGIMGIPDQATTATTYFNWLIHDPEQADIPKHEVCSDDCKWSRPKDEKTNSIAVFQNPSLKKQSRCIHGQENRSQILGLNLQPDVEQHEDLW